ncbi:MAG: EamA family transporter [Oscillospiraceae bacterium]|nr:EamA family transporter [Oscillospiraceae bacterium]
MKKYLPYIFILTAGIAWGSLGIFTRNLVIYGFTPKDIVLVRNFGGLVVMTVLFFFMDRNIFRIKLRHFPFFIGTGIVSVMAFTLLYFTCQQHCSLAVSAILLYTSPVFVMVMSALIWKDKITKQKLLALFVTLAGCAAVSGIFSGNLTVTAFGFITGIGSGFFYALYSIFGRFALQHYKPYTVTYYTFLCAGLTSLLVASPAKVISTFSLSPSVPFLAVCLVLIGTVLPFVMYTKGLAEVESGKAAILACMEPVSAALVGVIVFGEPMTMSVAAGLLCILTAVYILR